MTEQAWTLAERELLDDLLPLVKGFGAWGARAKNLYADDETADRAERLSGAATAILEAHGLTGVTVTLAWRPKV